MSHTALRCFRLGCVNECAARGADSHACSRHECPLMSRSGGGERHDGSDGGGRHGTEGGEKRGSVFGRGRTVRKTHHSRVGSCTLPVTPPPLSLFLSLGSGVLLPLPLSFPLHRSLHNFTSAPQHSPALSQPSLRHLGPHPPWHNAGIIRDLMEVAIFCRGGITMAMSSIHHCPPSRPFFSFSASIHFPLYSAFFQSLVALSCRSDRGAERCVHLAPGRSSCLIYGDIGLGSRVCVRLHVFDAGDTVTARLLHGAAVRSDTSARTNTSGNTHARKQ